MKIWHRLLILLVLYTASFNAAAYNYYPMQGKNLWSVGFDVFGMYAEPREDFHQIIRSTQVGSTIYIADRFNNPFGFELGFSWTARKPLSLYSPAGSETFNTVASVTSTQTCKFRLKDTYLDFHAHLRMCRFVEGKIALGVGFVRQSLQFYSNPTSGGTMQAALLNMQKKTGITGRLGLGAQAMLTNRVGLRFMFLYETMSNVKIRDTPKGVNPQILHDSGSIDLGIYWTFQGLRQDHQIRE